MARCLGNPWRVGSALLLGLATTVLIAWAAMFRPRSGGDGPGLSARNDLGLVRTADGLSLWQVDEGHNAWCRVVQFSKSQMSGKSLMIPDADYQQRKFELDTLPSHLRPPAVDDLFMLAWYREAGWPMPALTCSTHWVTQVSNADILYRVEGGMQLPRDADFHPRALPLTPLWVGLAVDLAAWSAVWFAVITGLAALRRRRRQRAGCCTHCGYPRTGLAEGSLCPECGC